MAPKLLKHEYLLSPMLWSDFEHFRISGSIIYWELFLSLTRCFRGTSSFVTFLLFIPRWEHLLHLWLGAYNICHIIIYQLRFILFKLDFSFGRVWEEQGWRNTDLCAMLWKPSWMWVLSTFGSSDKSSKRYNADLLVLNVTSFRFAFFTRSVCMEFSINVTESNPHNSPVLQHNSLNYN